MIVSESGMFLNAETSRQGSSMVMHVRDKDLVFNKKVRYESQLKEDRVLLQPSEFKEWRSKLD